VEPAKPEPGPAADPDKLIKDAQQAWFRGQYTVAIDSARKALRVKSNLTNAYQIIAVCSCALHDADSAAKAYERLDERNKLYVKSACQKSGISF
jgi:tetratricopeptide (TPR) repeat protein